MNTLKTNGKIIILRHGESVEDLNKDNHKYFEDDEMPLTDLGIKQAQEAGETIKKEVADSDVVFYISPSKRVLETTDNIISRLDPEPNVDIHVVKEIRKQDWGKVLIEDRPKIEKERYEIGVLNYSFPKGETSEAYLGRFQHFIENLKNDIKTSPNVLRVIITHGFELRLILMYIFNWDEKYLESLEHPNNCEIKKITINIKDGEIEFF
jgi:broad specificity phosphatase PhoE